MHLHFHELMKVGYQLRDRKRATSGKPNQNKTQPEEQILALFPNFFIKYFSLPFFAINFLNSGRFMH